MQNFILANPTRLVFGRGTIARLGEEIPAGRKIMVTFGGGSVRRNGVYDAVRQALAGREAVEFWGIEPNPKVETLRRAVEVCRSEGVDFLLAVGGGSVLDGTKLIASAVRYEGDAWELVLRGRAEGEVLPFASVMTLPATGSEMNNGAVISSERTHEKFAFYTDYPLFSVLDPDTTYSLPPYQVAVGIADTFVHVMEQYMTRAGQSPLMDRWAEGILLTLTEVAPRVLSPKQDDDARATYMLAATLALNGFIALGVEQDWATHMIGHEITALHGTTHGHTLVVVLPGLLKELLRQKRDKLVQYGERVWGIGSEAGTPEERAMQAIDRTEAFFRSLGLTTRLGELGIGEQTVAEIERRFRERGSRLGERENIDAACVRRILERCR